MDKELSYYELYLLDYLKKYHPEKAGDTEFIQQRADSAAALFEASRLQGYSVIEAQEFAMAELTKELHFSKRHMILEILESEFNNAIPAEKRSEFAVKVTPYLNEIFSQYLSDDFTLNNNSLYTEITGAISLYLEEYGL